MNDISLSSHFSKILVNLFGLTTKKNNISYNQIMNEHNIDIIIYVMIKI